MPDGEQGASWPPRWDLPPDMAPARGPAEARPAADPPTPARSLPPATGYALPPDLPSAPAVAPPPAAPRGAGARPDQRHRALVIGAVAAVLLVVGVLAVLRPWEVDATAVGTGGTTSAAAGPVPSMGSAAAAGGGASAVSASAGCVSAPSKDAGGNPTSYTPDNAIDDRPETAWRCDGDGVGQSLTIDLGRPVTFTDVGIVPGLAKTDTYDGTDRYKQCRRISAVRLTFDDAGDGVIAQLDTSSANRAVQRIAPDAGDDAAHHRDGGVERRGQPGRQSAADGQGRNLHAHLVCDLTRGGPHDERGGAGRPRSCGPDTSALSVTNPNTDILSSASPVCSIGQNRDRSEGNSADTRCPKNCSTPTTTYHSTLARRQRTDRRPGPRGTSLPASYVPIPCGSPPAAVNRAGRRRRVVAGRYTSRRIATTVAISRRPVMWSKQIAGPVTCR